MNEKKLELYFSKGTHVIEEEIGTHVSSLLVIYLGDPLSSTILRNFDFNGFIDKIKKKL